MVKRAAQSPSKPRKRARGRGRRNGGDSSEDEEAVAQLRRKQILENNDDDEEMMAEYREEGGEMLDDIYIPPQITRNEHPFTGERLVIEKIVCENFKSYGGIKEMGPFHKSFSAIIGPNGNGKSNIIDAMLFVFGYRASKIRCKKVSTLIHKSELLPNLKSCAVTVHFVKIIDDGNAARDDYDIVPNSQITVMRRAQANNSSTYCLDGKSVKFQEVATFLKANGIDIVHNRFLILQGEVEQIAQMPPISPNGHDTGLLEFLEEVIGTKRYIKPLAQLDQRVEVLDYERDEKLQRVDMAEKEKVALTEPVKRAKDFLRDQNSKTKYLHMLYQVKAHNAKKTVEVKEKVKVEMEEKLAVLQKRLDEINEINSARKDEFQKAEKLFKVAEKEYNKVKKALEAAEQQYIQLNQELQRTNETRKKLQKDSVKLEEEIVKLNSLPENHQREIDQLKKRKAELEVDVEKEEAAVKGDLEKLNVTLEATIKQKEVADKEFARLKRIRDEKKTLVDKSQKELTNYKERELLEQKKMTDLEAELETLKESVKRKEKEGRTSLGTNQLGGKEENLRALEEQAKKLSAVEANKRTVFEQARNEFQQAQESADGSRNLDKVDKALLEAKEDGILPGIYGRLKNLATIPEKYNIAATMASGQLDHWITDNDDTAGKCIQFLREKNLDSQTFVCLSRIQQYGNSMRERFDTPANSNRIFDLLNISKPELAPAYFKAFRNTLVADNIDIATKVSAGDRGRRHRVVTLKGEIVETTGSMQGGGRPVREGKFNSKKSTVTVTKQQLANLKQLQDEATKDFQNAQDARQAAEEKVRTLSEQIQDLKRKINNYNSDLAAIKAQLPLKEANVNEQRKKVKDSATLPQLLKEKEKFLEKANTEYQASLEPFEEAEENAASMAEKVKQLQVNKKNEITKKLDKFKEMLKKVTTEMNKKIVELKNCETNRKKSETKLATIRKEIEKLQNNMAKTSEQKKELEANAKETKDSEPELAEKLDKAKKEFDEVKGRAHEFQAEENKLNKEKVTSDNLLADAVAEVNDCKKLLKSMTANMQHLELKDIPEERVEPLVLLKEEEIQQLSTQELEHKVQKYNQKLKRDEPNLNILEDYKAKVNQLFQRIKELEEATQKRDLFREQYCKLDRQRATEFMEGFAMISSRLKEMFRMISMGGDAELEVVDILDLFGCGVQFSVRPARKTWKKISNLSGGEKTLASLSLVFALHHFKPSPFYVMDEIDAALDFKNVSIIANYIKDRTKFTQFIIISLRSNMFELADSLLGVYKVDNMSYSIHIGVKRLINELKKKYETGGKGALGTQDPNRPETQKEPVPGTSKDIPPGEFPNNLSAIVDEREGAASPDVDIPGIEQDCRSPEEIAGSPMSQDMEMEVVPESPPTVLENSQSGEDNTLNADSANRNEVEESEPSQDVFNETEEEAEQNSIMAGPGPLAASTPFVGTKRTSAIIRKSGDRKSNTITTEVGEDNESEGDSDDSFASCKSK